MNLPFVCAADIVLTTTHTDVQCSGASGSASVIANGGVGGFTYLWSTQPAVTTSSITSMSGSYSVTVMDSNSCQKTASLIIAQPAGT